MVLTLLPLLMALVALIALDGLSLRFGADSRRPSDDRGDW